MKIIRFLLFCLFLISFLSIQAQELPAANIQTNGFNDNEDDLDDDDDGILDADEGYCVDVIRQSYFSNPSFEEFEQAPDGISQVDRAVDWSQVSAGTSDYFHADSFDNTPELGPLPPTPHGKGFVGAATFFGFEHEYVGSNLLEVIPQGEEIELRIALGSPGEGGTIVGGPYAGEFVIYGFTQPQNFPFFGFAHISNLGNNPIELFKRRLDIPAGTWEEFVFTFTVPQDIACVVMGTDTGGTQYLLMDNLRLHEPCISIDTDEDGVPDYLDLDSDNDGISDLFESGADLTLDPDLNGIIDGAQFTDTDGDGLADAIETTNGQDTGTPLVDTDGDTIFDGLDLDADDDGIPDTVEAFPTVGYVDNDGDVSDNDIDQDGIIRLFDDNDPQRTTNGGTFQLPPNTDLLLNNNPDDLFDFLDTDSDGDGKLDVDEGGNTVSAVTYKDPNGSISNPITDLPDEITGDQEVAYREFCQNSFGPPQSFTECDAIILPPLPSGQYFTGQGGTGNQLSIGTIINQSQTIYVFDPSTTNDCYFETTVELNINQFTVVAEIGSDHAYCGNESPELLSSIIKEQATGLVTYQWQMSLDGTNFSDVIGEINETFQPFDQGQDVWYKRIDVSTLNGVSCSSETNAVKITVGGLQAAGEVSEDQIVCAGESPNEIIQIKATEYVGNLSFQWQISTDGINYTDIAGATDVQYTPALITETTWIRRIDTVSDQGYSCSSETNAILLQLNEFTQDPVIENDQLICFEDVPERLTASTESIASGFLTHQWQSSLDNVNFVDIPGETSKFYQPFPTTNTFYRRVDISDFNGSLCETFSNTVSVKFQGFTQTGLIGSDQLLCDNGPEEIEVTLAVIAEGTLSHQWQMSTDNINFTDIPSATDLTYQPANISQITWFRRVDEVVISDVTSCHVNTNTVKITPLVPLSLPSPNVSILDCDQNNIAAASVSIDPSLISGGSGNITNYTFKWDNNTPNDTSDDDTLQSGASNQYIDFDTSAKRIIVEVQDELGCTGTKDILVPERISLSTEVVLVNHLKCIDDSANFTVQIDGGLAPYATSLNSTNAFEEDKFIYDQLSPQLHTLYVRDARGCTQEIPIQINDGVDLEAELLIDYECNDAGNRDNNVVVQLNDQSINQNELSYQIDLEEEVEDGEFSNMSAGSHSIRIIHNNGCINQLAFDIEPYETLGLELNAVDDINTIKANGYGGQAPYEYRLDPLSFSDQNIFNVDETGQYTVSIRDQFGCIVENSVYLEFLDVRIPNYFTPDGDGVNDTWMPHNLDHYPDAEIRIYDRYGRLIRQLEVNEAWFGDYYGEMVPSGDYWYVIKFNRIDNNKELMGNFSLVR